MAAEDVGAAARPADVAQRQLHDTGRAHHGIADRVLGLAHAPYERAGPVFVHQLGHLEHGRFVDAAGVLDFVGRPFGQDVGLDLVHAVDARIDVRLVFPAVLEDVVQQAEQKGDVGARADAHVMVGLGRRAGKARVDHDHLAAVFLGVQHVQHRYRVRFGGVGADVQRHFGILHVVVRIGHGAVAPCIRNAGHRGRVADARLVVAVVAAPETDELAQQVRLLVVVLGRADPVDGIRTAFLAQLHQLGGDFLVGGVPADALVLAVDQFHGIAQAVFAVAVLAHRRALGAMRAQVDGRIEHRFLAHPDAVLDDGVHRAPDGTVRTDGAAHVDLGVADGHPGLAFGGFGALEQRQLGGREAGAHAQARAAQEGTAVHGGKRLRHAAAQALHESRLGGAGGGSAGFLGQQHAGLRIKRGWSCSSA
ncbi:hypothetical protein FQZ97_610850 [compost metagenome]